MRLAEFGFGFGKMGLQLMPLLVQGSTFEGIDEFVQVSLQGTPGLGKYPFEFHAGSIYEAPVTDNSFDGAMTHTVLMHVPYPEKVLQEMIRVTRPKGIDPDY